MATRDELLGKIVKFCHREAMRTHYELNRSNPVYEDTGVLGLINIKYRSDDRLSVYWSNGEHNSYVEGELTLATPTEVIKYFKQIKKINKREKVREIKSLSYPLTTITKETLCYTKGN